jgi:hypothetical protein
MKTHLSWLLNASAVAALSLGVTAPAHGEHNERGCAILPPWECPDPPRFNSANGDIGKKGAFHPYYSPLIPISLRWRDTQLTPYYPGYCAKGKHGPADGYCGPGAEFMTAPEGVIGSAGTYGYFTGAGRDDARFSRMGGNGLVPYGAPQPPRGGAPDIIDMIEAGRPHPGRGCP